MAGNDQSKQSTDHAAARNDQPGRSSGGVQVGTGGMGHDSADAARDPAKTTNQPGAALPHERDQAQGSVDDQPREVMKQAKSDIDAGMVDTDMRATPGLDAERRESMVPTPGKQGEGKSDSKR